VGGPIGTELGAVIGSQVIGVAMGAAVVNAAKQGVTLALTDGTKFDWTSLGISMAASGLSEAINIERAKLLVDGVDETAIEVFTAFAHGMVLGSIDVVFGKDFEDGFITGALMYTAQVVGKKVAKIFEEQPLLERPNPTATPAQVSYANEVMSTRPNDSSDYILVPKPTSQGDPQTFGTIPYEPASDSQGQIGYWVPRSEIEILPADINTGFQGGYKIPLFKDGVPTGSFSYSAPWNLVGKIGGGFSGEDLVSAAWNWLNTPSTAETLAGFAAGSMSGAAGLIFSGIMIDGGTIPDDAWEMMQLLTDMGSFDPNSYQLPQNL
jgi:hypothetical protein